MPCSSVWWRSRVLLQKTVDEHRDVLAALAQRRQADREHRQAVVEILTERVLAHLELQVAIGRGDHAHVDLARTRVADGHDLALLQHAQQLRLHAQRHLADLVEEDRAAARRLEEAAVILGRAGERAAAMAEQLALEQGLGHRGAVDRQEGLVGARRGAMDAARDQLLAGARLALDQDGDRRRGGALHQLEDFEHGRGSSRRSRGNGRGVPHRGAARPPGRAAGPRSP